MDRGDGEECWLPWLIETRLLIGSVRGMPDRGEMLCEDALEYWDASKPPDGRKESDIVMQRDGVRDGRTGLCGQ